MGLLLCAAIALFSALPQYGGLRAIAPAAHPVETGFRILAQSLLLLPLLPLLFLRNAHFTSGRFSVLAIHVLLWLTLACYAHFPSPFFDYVWDVFLIESIFVYLLSRAFLLDARTARFSAWPLRLLLFKLMLCMGVVKFLHGMPEWRSGLALKFFWANQPMPAFAAWYAAGLPAWIQKTMVAFVFLVEIPGPFLIFFGRRARLIFFFLNLLLQLGIFVSGNYGFFNILTVVVGFALLDPTPPAAPSPLKTTPGRIRAIAQRTVFYANGVILAGWLLTSAWYIYRAIAPGENYLHETSWVFLRNREQAEIPQPMRALLQTYAAAKVSNPYALFGMIPKYRLEIGLEGSADGAEWKKYRFRVRPDALDQSPIWYAPHHWRLDHQMYYESFRIREPRLHAKYSFFLGVRFIAGFIRELSLANEKVTQLFAENPFPSAPPKLFRFNYRYYLFTDADEREKTGHYWKTDTPHAGQFFEKSFDKASAVNLP